MGLAELIWRGEVYDVALGQPVGHEPGFTRPAVIVSADLLNNGPGGLVMVVPVTSARYRLRSHIELAPGTSGLHHTSYARCDQLRVVSTARIGAKRGALGLAEISEINQAIRFVLDL